MAKIDKPLGMKAYGHIPHLPGSRLGPADHCITEGQAHIATVKPRDRHDYIVVEEKLDGSCVAVANIGGAVTPLIRAGYRADNSHYRQHHLFAAWVYENQDRFLRVLSPGDRIVGEWLAQAHGTRYQLPHEPFVVFDFFAAQDPTSRLPAGRVREIAACGGFVTPHIIYQGPASFPVERALEAIQVSHHGAMDPVEGAVWRVERKGGVDFLCKFVRHDKEDGKYLPELSGSEPVWNWLPEGQS